MIAQAIQLIGAFLLLGGYAGAQLGKLDSRSPLYLLLNVLGSGLLALVAMYGRQWGFILLECSWTLISLAGLVRWRFPSQTTPLR